MNHNNTTSKQLDNTIQSQSDTDSILQHEIDLRQLQDAALNDMSASVAASQALVGDKQSIGILFDEYKNNLTYYNKIKQLQNKYKYIRNVRGDGSCFYRAYMYGIFELACNKPSVCNQLIKTIEPTLDQMCDNTSINADRFTIEDFYDTVMDQLRYIRDNQLSSTYLIELFNDESQSESIVYYARLLTSLYLQTHIDDCAPFISDGMMTMQEYVDRQVLRVGVDAEHLGISALTSIINVCCIIEYLDQTNQQLNHHTFPNHTADTNIAVALLYKLNHYDLLSWS